MVAALLTPPDSEPSTPPFEDKPEYITTSSVPRAAKNAADELQGASAYPSRKGYKDSLLSLTDSLASAVLSSVTTFSYGPVVAACRSAILAMMAHSITWGRLRILTLQPGSASGGVYVFPSYEQKPKQEGEDVVDIRVLSDTFWIRLVTLGDLGFAEAYMAGDCEVSDLVQVFQIFIRSRPALSSSSNISGVSTIPSRIFSIVTSMTNSRFANTLSNSLSNIRAHYDLSNGMFAAFLSRDMMYSCAIFPELDKDLRVGESAQLGQREQVNGGMGLKRIANGPGSNKSAKKNGQAEANNGQKGGRDELEDAQMAKLRHIIKKADIRPGHRVLEIGSGWGAFAIEAVRTTNCTVDTITLSAQQKALAEERIKEAGLSGRIRVWLMDYRNLPESWMGAFDRVVSIEMLEAVGKEYIQGYFSVLDKVLNERGVACIQVITIPESRFEKYQQEVDFIRKWIFPGGFLPTVTYVTECVQKGADNRLVIDSISNIGPHYARTLREWRRRFLKTFASQTDPAMRVEHPEMTDADIEVFKRKWIYYFCYCEVGFSERVIGDHIFTLVREGNRDYGCTTYE